MHCPQKRPWLLVLPRGVIHSVARFRQRIHTLCFEAATWIPRFSPTCDLCEAADDQDEQHAIFHCTPPHTVSLRRRHESLFLEARAQDVSTFLHQNNIKLYFFLHELNVFYEQVSSRTLCMKAFSCIPCKLKSNGLTNS